MIARTNIVEFRAIGLVWTVSENKRALPALAASPMISKFLIDLRVM
jgi:hypothetical protein